MRDLLVGLRRGALLGACMAASALGVSKGLEALVLSVTYDPFTRTTAVLCAWTTLVAAALGGAATAVAGRKPAWRDRAIHLVPAPFVAMALVHGTYPLAQAGSVALGWALYMALRTAGTRWPRSTVVAVLAAAACVAGMRTTPPPRVVAAKATAPAGAPNVLWVVFDTVRADHLPTGGYARDTGPRTAALAAEGVVFERAYTPSPWTLPSHASMFTGLYPSRHGCHDAHLFLDATMPTVAELLGARGWDTALLASNAWVGTSTGLDRGFDHVVAAWNEVGAGPWFPAARLLGGLVPHDKGATAVDAGLTAWLDARAEGRPFFAVVNYLEAHTPYHELAAVDRDVFVAAPAAAEAASRAHVRRLYSAPDGPPPTAEEAAHLVDLYDAGVRADDRHLGVLLDDLDRRGLLDDTLVIVTSDHGESLGEDGRWDHHIEAAEAVLHVPLVLRFPKGANGGRRVPDNVSLVDLLPTVLDAVGLAADVPAGAEGRSLLPLLSAGAPERVVFAETWPPAEPVVRRRVEALGHDPLTWRWWTAQLGGARLYRGPPAERIDVLDARPVEPAALRALLDAYVKGERVATGEVPAMDEATRARLKELGYVE